MIEAELFKRLILQAGKLLSRRAYSRGEIRQKLARYAQEESLDGVLAHLQELNLLNDSDYAYNFALLRMKQQGWGPLKVFQSLLRREVEPDLAESAIAKVYQETDEPGLLQEYLVHHCRKGGMPQDRSGIKRLIAHLRRRGFHEEVIFSTLRRHMPAAAWQRFDTGD